MPLVRSTCMATRVLLLVSNIIKQFSSSAEFHYQEEVLGSFYDLVQLNEVRVAN